MVEDSETVKQAIDRMRGTGYSRLPVFHEDQDDVIGIVRYKDLINPLLDDRETDAVVDYLADVDFVPESKDLASAAQRNANESSTDGHCRRRIRWNRWFNYHRRHR